MVLAARKRRVGYSLLLSPFLRIRQSPSGCGLAGRSVLCGRAGSFCLWWPLCASPGRARGAVRVLSGDVAHRRGGALNSWMSCGCMVRIPFSETGGLALWVLPRCLVVVYGGAPSEPRQSLMAAVPRPRLTGRGEIPEGWPVAMFSGASILAPGLSLALSLPALPVVTGLASRLPCDGLATAAATERAPPSPPLPIGRLGPSASRQPNGGSPPPHPGHGSLRAFRHPATQRGDAPTANGRLRRP